MFYPDPRALGWHSRGAACWLPAAVETTCKESFGGQQVSSIDSGLVYYEGRQTAPAVDL